MRYAPDDRSARERRPAAEKISTAAANRDGVLTEPKLTTALPGQTTLAESKPDLTLSGLLAEGVDRPGAHQNGLRSLLSTMIPWVVSSRHSRADRRRGTTSHPQEEGLDDAHRSRRTRYFEGNFMNRRSFVATSAGALAGWMIGSLLAQDSMPAQEASRLGRIGVSTWSFHNFFLATRDDKAVPGATLDMLDFPEMIADRYRLHELEFVAPHFATTTAAYIQEVKGRLEKAHSHLVNIPVDIDELELGGGLSDPDAKLRDRIIAACSKWIDIASELGAGSVRCDPGKINSADLGPTVASYRKLSAYGASKGVAVVVENHGGVGSEHPEELVKIFKEVGGKWFGALPGFGNFPDRKERERGLGVMF